MSSKVPHLLEPYLSLPPEASLILLTNVLGASSNWLILRFLYSTLAKNSDVLDGSGETKVLLVSFMRDGVFWKEGGKRLGLDLEKLALKKRFAFVDGLSGLFLPKPRTSPVKVGEKVLNSPELASVSKEIQQAIQDLKGNDGNSKILLIIDQLDLLLAAGGDQIGAINLGEMLMGWREEVHATVLSLSADYPLVAAQQTPLEVDHAALLLGVAHQADFTMGLRLLDTGTARDVSGVVRITLGNSAEENAEGDGKGKIEEKELLYFIGGDGGVKVFERGQ